MVHLNELHDKYQEQGLTVVAVSKQDRSAVKSFNEEFGAKYPTVIEKSDSMRAYGRSSFPSAFLINTNGRILWVGHPGNLSDAAIDEALDKTKILPRWPDALKAVRKLFEKDKYAGALQKVEAELAKEKLGEEDAGAAQGIRDWLAWYGESSVQGAAKDVENGKYYEASLNYDEIARLFKKHEFGVQAVAGLKGLLSDKDRKLEVKAGEKLAKVRAEIMDKRLKPKKALQKLKPLLSKKYAETAAGKKAAEMAEKLEEALDD